MVKQIRNPPHLPPIEADTLLRAPEGHQTDPN